MSLNLTFLCSGHFKSFKRSIQFWGLLRPKSAPLLKVSVPLTYGEMYVFFIMYRYHISNFFFIFTITKAAYSLIMAQVQGLSQNSPCLLQHQGPFSSPVFCLTACLCCSLTLWHPPRSVFSGCSTAESPPPDQLFEALWYVTSVRVLRGLKLK